MAMTQPRRSSGNGKPSAHDERRAQFARYKQDVKERGKPFYPYAMFHDTVMSLVVVSVIVGLATIWKWTSWGPHHDGLHQGILGPEYTAPADPGTTNFVPRPDWYFYFLFYLLRDLQVAGDGLPRHGRRADDRADPPDRAAVLRPPPRAPPAAPPGRVVGAVLVVLSMATS